MALIFLDSTPCSICNKTLKNEDNILGFASFLTNEHKFWEYSDSGMHKKCFEDWEHKEEFEGLYIKSMSTL